MKTVFTSESVTCGHPDKLCDRVSDNILDALLLQDPASRVACEVTATTDRLQIMGEITTRAVVDYEKLARDVIRTIGYTQPGHGFDADTCKIDVYIHQQSPDIAMGVDNADPLESGAGDQGMMFGYACRETEALMPLPITLANRLTQQLENVRKKGELSYLLPDGKAQVTVEYEDKTPVRISAVVVSTQHLDSVDTETLRKDVKEHVILPVLPAEMLDDETKIFINPTGRFVVGGPAGDTGLTGRKIIVDTYGGYARHGGGAFSGKDASKVDRSAAYMARYLAKNVVAAELATHCEVQLSYAIGVAQPVSVRVDTFGTGSVDENAIAQWLCENVDMRPMAIIRRLDLRRVGYGKLASYGHFGENALDRNWEKTDLAHELKAAF